MLPVFCGSVTRQRRRIVRTCDEEIAMQTLFRSKNPQQRRRRASAALCASLILLSGGCGGGSSTTTRNLVRVSVEPTNAQAIAPTGTAPFALMGIFDQPPTNDLLPNAQWSSSDPTIATIDATGLANCVAVGGPVTITGSSGQKQSNAQLTCVSEPQGGSGNCVYTCPSTRCPALTGYCSIDTGNACRQVYAGVQCPQGRPAAATGTDNCGAPVDTTRSCSD
jgi:Big-like domain-containing protein